jgi:effector-binding domain-containing protein
VAGEAAHVTMHNLGEVVPPLTGEVFGWLAQRGVAPAGPPFWKYNVIDMQRGLEVEAGVTVAAPVAGDARVQAGVLPAGRYATARHVGHPSTLLAATAALLDWAKARGLTWDVTPSPEGDRWGCRLELYLTDPRDEPDMHKWQTQLAFRLA